MPDIRQLPTSVINKIAAGEVIERPASVIKEVLENSVDAGATRIDVSIEKGGVDLLRVADNGCGIKPDQLALAVASHATSKIENADDLFQVETLGFRGEALASIAEISQFVIRSRVGGDDGGFELEVNGGQRSEVLPCGCPVGTIIEVRNLFFNTPVRRKFLKTTQTEFGHIGEAFTRIALAHPGIHFTLTHNGRQIHELPPVESWSERIGHFFGPELRDSLIPVSNQEGEIRLAGFVADPSQNRGNNRMQFLLLNGRFIRDRSLQHALSEAYRGLLLTGRFPIAFLRLHMPSSSVDVNVHPAKLEVRFQEGGKIYSQLLGTLRNRFLSTDLTARVQAAQQEVAIPLASDRMEGHRIAPHRPFTDQGGASRSLPGPSYRDMREPVSDRSQSELDLRFSNRNHSAINPFDLSVNPTETANIESQGATESSLTPGTESDSSESMHWHGKVAAPGTQDSAAKHRLTVLQVQDRYLITENEEGMVVVDQHALHERVIYEQIRERILSGHLERQRLLVPEPVSLSPAEAATAIDSKELLAKIGIELEPFGGDTVLISSVPTLLRKQKPADILRVLIDQLLGENKTPDRRDVLDELLHMISCKAAVKAGDRLSSEEMEALIAHLDLCENAHHCPHGRPTALVFSRHELDRRFKRI